MDNNLPNKKYNIIYADPPWSYKGKMMNSSVTDHYSVMSIDDIANMPVQDLADDNCVLFMWVTLPKLNEFMKVINGWGFEYKTTAFVWVKKNKKADSFFMGLGRWTRANPEICVLATKGNISRKSNAVRQLQVFRIEKHSKKPDEFRDLILELVGDLPRIELFAREKAEGWDVWGNEV
jgi:N6-adenosine-specific RNA methylase IME4|tara:strand:- start:40 stop:573 length:534 start_codon:yes stop_codon:yes gene_type:complete